MLPVDSITVATAFGALTSLGIIVGALLGVFAPLTHGVIARTTSIGAALLLAAASVELAAEVLELSPYVGIVVLLIGVVQRFLMRLGVDTKGCDMPEPLRRAISERVSGQNPEAKCRPIVLPFCPRSTRGGAWCQI